MFDADLKGVFLACRAAIPHLRRRGGRANMNVSSVQAFVPSQAWWPTRHRRAGSTRGLALAVDHARDGIRVNVVCPGSVDTPMLRWAAGLFGGRNEEELVREWGRNHPLSRVAGAAEVAEVTAFLAGSLSSFVTCTETRVDGGPLATVPVALPDQTAA